MWEVDVDAITIILVDAITIIILLTECCLEGTITGDMGLSVSLDLWNSPVLFRQLRSLWGLSTLNKMRLFGYMNDWMRFLILTLSVQVCIHHCLYLSIYLSIYLSSLGSSSRESMIYCLLFELSVVFIFCWWNHTYCFLLLFLFSISAFLPWCRTTVDACCSRFIHNNRQSMDTWKFQRHSHV